MKKLLLLLALSSTALAVDKQIIAPTGSVVVKGNSTVKMQTYNTGAWQDRLTIANDGTLTGNGSGLTSLNGTNISSGTVSASYLPAAGPSASGIVNQSTQIFAGAKTFSGGVLSDSISEVTSGNGVQVKGKTTGAVGASYIGEESATVNNSASANGYTLIASKTLGVGNWLVSVGYFGAGGQAGQHKAKLNIKGVAGSTNGDTYMECVISTISSCGFSFPTRIVTIVSGDSDRTVTVTGDATSNYNGYASIHAIRL